MNIGKSVRLERIFNRNTGRSIIVPLDHGTTVGPIYGLVDLRATVMGELQDEGLVDGRDAEPIFVRDKQDSGVVNLEKAQAIDQAAAGR